MTKPTWLCAQRLLRSAWASAKSDQSLHCLLEVKLWSLADLSLRWAQSHIVGFVTKVAHMCNEWGRVAALVCFLILNLQ